MTVRLVPAAWSGLPPTFTLPSMYANLEQDLEPSCQLDVVRTDIGGVPCELMRVSHVAREFRPHFFENHSITVVDAGACRVRTARGSWTAGPGSVIALAPEEVNEVEVISPEPLAYRRLRLSPELMAAWGAHDTDQGLTQSDAPVLQPSTLTAGIAGALDALAEDPGSRVRGEFLLGQVVRLARRDPLAVSRGRERDRELVVAARATLRSSIGARVHLAHVARDLHVSTFHLIRSFRDVMGVSPYAYLLILRVNHARWLLDAGASMSDAVYHCAFSDQSHLTRYFKQAFGVQPGRYARVVCPHVRRTRRR